MWIYLGLISAVLLGLYDVCKKHALNHNAVLPVLFLSTVAGLVPMLALYGGSLLAPDFMRTHGCLVPDTDLAGHLRFLLKSAIVSTSWVLCYFAMKHLPISICSPIRASGPAWTLLGAVLFFHERPTGQQWLGIAAIFAAYYVFSVAGRKDGVVFHRSAWILYMFLGTLVGSISTLYDKYLIQQLGYAPLLVQFWFSVYNTLLLGIVTACAWWPKRAGYTRLEWRWSIPAIGLLLIAADFVYFNAVKEPEALIVILSLLRRSSVVISFAVGALVFKDTNLRQKAWALAGILTGVLLIALS